MLKAFNSYQNLDRKQHFWESADNNKEMSIIASTIAATGVLNMVSGPAVLRALNGAPISPELGPELVGLHDAIKRSDLFVGRSALRVSDVLPKGWLREIEAGDLETIRLGKKHLLYTLEDVGAVNGWHVKGIPAFEDPKDITKRVLETISRKVEPALFDLVQKLAQVREEFSSLKTAFEKAIKDKDTWVAGDVLKDPLRQFAVLLIKVAEKTYQKEDVEGEKNLHQAIERMDKLLGSFPRFLKMEEAVRLANILENVARDTLFGLGIPKTRKRRFESLALSLQRI